MLRKKINKLGYIIKDEIIVFEDNKFYITIEFVKGNKKYSKKELYFGPILLNKKDNLFYDYFKNIKSEKEYIFSKLPDESKKKKDIL